MLFLLWTGDEFDGAPLGFRVMGTFVLSFFGLIGWGLFNAGPPKLRAKELLDRMDELADKTPDASRNYTCHNCGATLGAKADVSPHGDVKCGQCGRWFNIHHAPS